MTKVWYSKVFFGLRGVSNSWSCVKDQMSYFSSHYVGFRGFINFSDSEGEEFDSTRIDDIYEMIPNLTIGDVIYMDFIIDGKEKYTHAVIITEINAKDIFYASHTRNRSKYSLLKAVENYGESNSLEYLAFYHINNNAKWRPWYEK